MMKKVTINLYEFEELNKNSQTKAIEDHRGFLLSATYPSDFEYEGDFESTICEIENDDDYVKENIKINDYLFYSDGELANCTTYTGKHSKSGITELKLGNDVYTL